jgi:alpha-galactosidase
MPSASWRELSVTITGFIGAGSLHFTHELVRDILTFPLLDDATIPLMDIDPERADFAHNLVRRIGDMGRYPAKVEATLDREEALRDADAVLVTYLAGGTSVWRHDIGDTRSVSGVFSSQRTTPVMVRIVRDVGRLCPDGILLDYTNPIAVLCRAMQGESSIKLTGLCHRAEGTTRMLARWIGAPRRRR